MLQLFVNDILVELDSKSNVSYHYDLSTFSPSAFATQYTTTLDIPFTHNNIQVFGHPSPLLIAKSYPYKLYYNASLIDTGTLIPSKVTPLVLSCNLHSLLVDVNSELSDLRFVDVANFDDLSGKFSLRDDYDTVRDYPITGWNYNWSTSGSRLDYDSTNFCYRLYHDTYNPVGRPPISGRYLSPFMIAPMNIGYPQSDDREFAADKLLDYTPNDLYFNVDLSRKYTPFEQKFKLNDGQVYSTWAQFRPYQLSVGMSMKSLFYTTFRKSSKFQGLSTNARSSLYGWVTLPDLSTVGLGSQEYMSSVSYGRYNTTVTDCDRADIDLGFVDVNGNIYKAFSHSKYIPGMTTHLISNSYAKVTISFVNIGWSITIGFYSDSRSNFPSELGTCDKYEQFSTDSNYFWKSFTTPYNGTIEVQYQGFIRQSDGAILGPFDGFKTYINETSHYMAPTIKTGGNHEFSMREYFSLIENPYNLCLDIMKKLNLRFKVGSEGNFTICHSNEFFDSSSIDISKYVSSEEDSFDPSFYKYKYIKYKDTFIDGLSWPTFYEGKTNKVYGEYKHDTGYPLENKDWFDFKVLKSTCSEMIHVSLCSEGYTPMAQALDSEYTQTPITYCLVTHYDYTSYPYISGNKVFGTIGVNDQRFRTVIVNDIHSPSDTYTYDCYLSGRALENFKDSGNASPDQLVTPFCTVDVDDLDNNIYRFSERYVHANNIVFTPTGIYNRKEIYIPTLVPLDASTLNVKMNLSKFLLVNGLSVTSLLHTKLWYKNKLWAIAKLNSYVPDSESLTDVTLVSL